MRVLMLSVRSDFGGGPEHLFQLLQQLQKKENIKFYVAAPKGAPYKSEFERLVSQNNFFLLPYRKFKVGSFLKLLAFVHKNKINILHSHGKGAGVYSRLVKMVMPKIKVVHTLHGYHDGNYGSIQKKVYALLEGFFSIFTNKIINVSEGERNAFINSVRVKFAKCIVIPNGVEDLKKHINPKNEEGKGGFKICYLSRPEYQKNVDEILKISVELLKLIEGRFCISVFGEVEPKLKNLMLLDDHFDIKGSVKNVNNTFGEYDVFVNTSRWEGMPLSILEAMSSEVPVVASNVTGNNSILRDGENGYLYELYNVKDAAQKIASVQAYREKAKQLVLQAKLDIMHEYSVVSMAENTFKLYCEL